MPWSRYAMWATGFLSATALYARGAIVASTDAEGRFGLEGVADFRLVGARSAGFAPSELELVHPGIESELTLRLTRGGVDVQGIVLDEEGRPVPGATVIVGDLFGGQPWRWDVGINVPSPRPRWLSTANDGTFRCEGLAPGRISAFAFSPDHPVEAETTTARAGETVRFELHLERGSRVTGAVLASDGTLAAGARVEAQLLGFHSSWVVANADGHFEIRGVRLGQVAARAESDTGEFLEVVLDIQEEEVEWNPVLRGGIDLYGTLRDEKGIPLPGLTVVAKPLDDPNWWVGVNHVRYSRGVATTDENGGFRIPACSLGAHTVEVWVHLSPAQRFPCYVEKGVFPGEAWNRVVERAETVVVSAQLVVADAEGRPLQGATVLWARIDEPWWSKKMMGRRGLEADADGRVRHRSLRALSYEMTISEPRHQTLVVNADLTLDDAARGEVDLGLFTLAPK